MKKVSHPYMTTAFALGLGALTLTLPVRSFADKSNTPASKSVVISIRASEGETPADQRAQRAEYQ